MSNLANFLTELALVEAEFPKGEVAYHKATGQAFVVVGYGLNARNELVLQCDSGNAGISERNPVAMTLTRPDGGSDDAE